MESEKSHQAHADKGILSFSKKVTFQKRAETTYIENFNPNALNYDMKRKGVVIFFSNKKYSYDISKVEEKDCDLKNLVSCFRKLNFDHKIYCDASKKDIEHVLNKVSEFELSDLSCLIIIVLTHGNSTKQLAAFDSDYDSSIFWKKLKGKLIGIPKIFIIQNCKNHCLSTEASDSMHKVSHKFIVPEMADFLQLYFSYDGSCSENSSSRFIEILCKVLEENNSRWDILQMLTYVNKKIIDESYSNSDEKTLPQIVSTLTKFLKFERTKTIEN